MSASQLVVALRSAGLTVVEDPGWASRGNRWGAGKPIGQMEHHTAAPVPYPVNDLNGSDADGRLKCNQNIKPDGTVVMIAYLATNYASGPGSDVVYKETLNRKAPPANAKSRGLTDNMVGNQFYWNIENDHYGNGSEIPDVQYQAILASARIVNQHFGLVANQVISHAEWTARKIDPYWNGSQRTAADIRADLEEPVTRISDEDVERIARRSAELTAPAASDAVWLRDAYSGEYTSGPNQGQRINLAFQLDRIYRGNGRVEEISKVTNENTNTIIAMLSAIPGADLDAVARATADEIDKRARERLGTG